VINVILVAAANHRDFNNTIVAVAISSLVGGIATIITLEKY
jgi:hypothetical protein